MSEKEIIKNLNNLNISKKLKCPYCFEVNKHSEENQLLQEFPIKCSKCTKLFYYIKCFHCVNPIYYSEIIDFYNCSIHCPYKNCHKKFSIVKCDKCETKIFFNGRFPVKCPNQSCQNIFVKIKCPQMNCTNSITLSKNNNNLTFYEEGSVIQCNKHLNPFKFQIINCYHCSRNLLWPFTNFYIAGQIIQCPYKDCLNSFNIINCHNCKKNNFFPKGNNIYGVHLKCIYCKFNFTNLFCPYCLKGYQIKSIEDKNEGDNKNYKYVDGNILNCPLQNEKNPHNKKNFQLVTCIYCKQINIFREKNPYYHGQSFECSYKNCQKKFNKIPCPFCLKFNIFPKNDFSYGTMYKCVYKNCEKNFSIFLCPNCKNYQVETEKIIDGQNVKCLKCNTNFFSIRCPHCLNSIFGINYRLRFGESILCPYLNCQKLFNYYFCCTCKKPLYDKNNTYSDSNLIKCAYKDCQTNFSNYVCPNCDANNFIKITDISKYKPIVDDVIQCMKCKSNFYPSNQIRIFNEGITIKFYKGDIIKFNQPLVDPFEEIQIKRFIPNEELYNMIASSKSNQLTSSAMILEQAKEKEERTMCCFCLSKISESVFIPCGHRCVCYECGTKIMKDGKKKCPICQEDSSFLLAKVYDT